MEFTCSGYPNRTDTVESSTNLVTWQNRGTGLPGVSGVMPQLVTRRCRMNFSGW